MDKFTNITLPSNRNIICTIYKIFMMIKWINAHTELKIVLCNQCRYSNKGYLLWFFYYLLWHLWHVKVLTMLVFLILFLVHVLMRVHFPSIPPTSLAIHSSSWLPWLCSVFKSRLAFSRTSSLNLCSVQSTYHINENAFTLMSSLLLCGNL